MSIPVEQLVLLLTSLFAIFSPPANIGPIAAISGRFSAADRRRIALQVAISYAVVLIASAWVGQWLLDVLGVTVEGLTVTGGIALLFAGFPLMMEGNTKQAKPETADEASQQGGWRSVVVVPLSFPMTIGGATAAIVMATASRYDSVLDLTAISVVCVLAAVIIFATHYYSGPIANRLDPQKMDILSRISGIILVSISMQLIIKGIIEMAIDAGVGHLLVNLGG